MMENINNTPSPQISSSSSPERNRPSPGKNRPSPGRNRPSPGINRAQLASSEAEDSSSASEVNKPSMSSSLTPSTIVAPVTSNEVTMTSNGGQYLRSYYFEGENNNNNPTTGHVVSY